MYISSRKLKSEQKLFFSCKLVEIFILKQELPSFQSAFKTQTVDFAFTCASIRKDQQKVRNGCYWRKTFSLWCCRRYILQNLKITKVKLYQASLFIYQTFRVDKELFYSWESLIRECTSYNIMKTFIMKRTQKS